MNKQFIETLVLAAADGILTEAGKYPAYIDVRDCKKKRELRNELVTLKELSASLGCSERTTHAIHTATHAWLENGLILNVMPQHESATKETPSTTTYEHVFTVNGQHALTLTTNHDVFISDAFSAGVSFLISQINFPKAK